MVRLWLGILGTGDHNALFCESFKMDRHSSDGNAGGKSSLIHTACTALPSVTGKVGLEEMTFSLHET